MNTSPRSPLASSISPAPVRRHSRRRARVLAGSIAGLVLGAALWLPAPAPAATITWGSPTNISGDANVSTAGTAVGALNLGATGVADTTVNGVIFNALAVSGTSVSSGNFTFSAAGGLAGFNGAGAAAAPFSGLSSSYQGLLGSLGGTSPNAELTLQMSGLTVGETYQFQWWYNLSSISGFSFTNTAAAGNNVTLDDNTTQATGGLGQYAIGTFVADAATQTILFNSGTSTGVNGLQLRNITPGTAYWTGDQNSTWTTNNAGNTNWASDLAGTVDTGAIPGASTDVVFSADNVTLGSQNTTLGADFTIHTLTVNDTAAVTIGGPSYTLTISGDLGTGITVNSGANLTIGANVTFAGASNTVTVNGTGVAVIDGVLGGANGLAKQGAGSLTLNGLNTYTGDTLVEGGSLVINGSTNTTNTYVGYSNSGTSLTISNGGDVTNASATIGVSASAANNLATVTGTGSTWTTTGDLNVGFDGNTNTLSIENAGSVQANYTKIGGSTTATGNAVNISGADSLLTNIADLIVGYGGSTNTLSITTGGKATNVNGLLGLLATADTNSATVSGTGSLWENTGGLQIGVAGSGNTATISGGGKITATQDALLGFSAGSDENKLTVTGAGSRFEGSAALYVGNGGSTNTLEILSGGVATSVLGRIGALSTSSGNLVTIDGTGSLWDISGTIRVGGAGDSNTVNILNGGELKVAGNSFLGYDATSDTNALLVSGVGSKFTANALMIGRLGTNNTVTVADSGLLSATSIVLGQMAGSSGTLQIGNGGAAGTVSAPTIAGGLGTGSVVFNHTSTSYSFAPVMSGPLSVLHTAGATLLTSANTYTGGTTINGGSLLANNATGSATGTGGVAINSGGTFGGNGAVSGVATLNSGGFVAPGAAAAGISTATVTTGGLIWNGGGQLNLQLGASSATSDRLALNGELTKGTAGAYTLSITDAGGFGSQSLYSLVTFTGGTTFALGDFTLLPLPTGFTGSLALDADSLDLVLGFATTGTLIQNSYPVGTPLIANFTVDGAGTTGAEEESNTINALFLTPGSSLNIFNTLTVTSGRVGDLGPGQTSLTGGILYGPNGLTFNVNGTMNVTGTLQGDLTKTGDGSLLINGTLQGGAQVLPGLLGGNAVINGNLINGGTVSPGNSPGLIYVGGNYTQTSAGTLRIEVGGRNLGEFDRLVVTGQANLDGTVQLVRLNNFNLKRGDRLEFLTADLGVNGEFVTVDNPFTSETIMEPSVVYYEQSVALELVQGSFKDFAVRSGLTPNQIAVAAALDSAAFDPRAEELIAYLDDRKLDKLPGDFDRIAPDELTSMFTISTALSQVQSTNLQRRTDDLRSGSSGFSASGLAINGMTPSYSGGLYGFAGPTGKDGKEIKESKAVITPPQEPEQRWGAFLTGVGEWVDVDGDGNSPGYDVTTGGFTLGVDYKIAPNFAVGIMAGYAGTGSDLTNDGSVWVNSGKLGLYATTFAGGWYADVAVTGGYNSYDTKRSGIQGSARGSTDGAELNVLVGTGYDFTIGALRIGPTATFNYTRVGIDGYTEHGSLAPLDIQSRTAESIRSTFGIKASYDWKVGSVLIRPELRAAWQHEYGDTSYGLDASFASGAGNSFETYGPEVGRDAFLLGAGFAIQCSERCSTYLYYDGSFGRERYDSQSVSGGVRVTF